jgi:hypothetical protein
MTDYAELWLQAQRAHKDIFEAALRKDWQQARDATERLRACSEQLDNWFADAQVYEGGK